MKKFFAILLGVVITVATIALTSSCKKDIDNAKSLVGTKWVCNVPGEGITYTLTFTDQYSFKMNLTAEGRSFPEYKGTFVIFGNKPTLSGSTITLTPGSKWWYVDDEDKVTFAGEFKSDKELDLETYVFDFIPEN